MDESDQITLPILRQLGCAVPTGVTSMDGIDKLAFLNCVQTCLNAIEAGGSTLEVWTQLPSSIGRQSRMVQALLRGLELLNCRFASFDGLMYPNTESKRQILRFLVERLPSSGGTGDNEENQGPGSEDLSLSDRITAVLRDWCSRRYSALLQFEQSEPFSSVSLYSPALLTSSKQKTDDASTKSRSRENLAWLSDQVESDQQLIPSLIALNTQAAAYNNALKTLVVDDSSSEDGLLSSTDESNILDKDSIRRIFASEWSSAASSSSSSLMRGKHGHSSMGSGHGSQSSLLRRAQFTQESASSATMVSDDGRVMKVDDSGDVVLNKNDEELEEEWTEKLRVGNEKLAKLRKQLNKGNRQLELTKEKIGVCKESIESSSKEVEELTVDCKAKIKTLKLVPNAKDNLGKLQGIVDESRLKLESAKSKWEQRKQAFTESMDQRRIEFEQRKELASGLAEESQRLRSEMRSIADDLQSKDELCVSIASKLDKLAGAGISRQVYVDRILAVVKSLSVQKKQIDSIVSDVRELQTSTDRLSEQAKRVFLMTDDLVFNTAQKCEDNTLRKHLNELYREVDTIRERFDVMIDTIKQVSNLRNDLRDLSHQTEALQEKVDDLDIAKVVSDIAEVEEENQQMAAQLKANKKELKARVAAAQAASAE